MALLATIATSLPCAVFTEVARNAGIRWRHWNGKSPDKFLVETTTGGVGLLDFNNDGLLDIFFVNGGDTPRAKSPIPVRCALYRNLGNGKFEDVATKAGLPKMAFYGMGVAAADYDNDGFTDLYVSGYPQGALFHNNGDGTFTDVTAKAGVANTGEWGASAAWFDYDRDGRLDLFIANYAQFSFAEKKTCKFAEEPAYCAQTEYRGSQPRLYHNNGDGTFTDVSMASGIAALSGRALGVLAIDADGDGWTDLFVARDASPNLLLINQHDGTFRDKSVEADVAYNADGVARSGMGVDAADLNGDGLPDFVVTNFDHEYHALYLSKAGEPYQEATVESGLARNTEPYVGWGVRFLDFNHDGSSDLLIANGHLHPQIALSNREVSYREPLLLLENSGKATFRRVGSEAGPVFGEKFLARGLATGDYDNDGATDAVVIDLNSRPLLLHNTFANGNHWLGIKLQGTMSNRDAIGARLTLHRGGGSMTQWITGGGSFLATSDRRVVFGLGRDGDPGHLEIQWPNGNRQTVDALKVNQYQTVREAAAPKRVDRP